MESQSSESAALEQEFARCLERAESALASHRIADACVALAEARVLDPAAPDVQMFEQRLAAVARRAERRNRLLAGISATALFGFSIFIVSRVVTSTRSDPKRVADAHHDVVLKPDVRSGATTRVVQEIVIAREEVPRIVGTAGRASAEPPVPRTVRRDSFVPIPQSDQPRGAPPEPVSRPSDPPAVGAHLSSSDPPAVPLPAIGDGAAPYAPASAMQTADDHDLVRAVLSRYESAYSRLDAAAAQAIWPGVDQRALARAFEGLATQRVSLGSCSVHVFGGQAYADCAGTATWAPKIGGGLRTQPRHWTFQLRNSGTTGWQIVTAGVR